MIAILDFGAGNLFSVKYALDILGCTSFITNEPAEVENADRIIFPGVGAAKTAMQNLRTQKLDEALISAYESKKPILGICIGMQLIFDFSEENEGTDCIGLMKGRVAKFKFKNPNIKIPQMGWNQLAIKKQHTLLTGVTDNTNFYFVHSYYAVPENPRDVIGQTTIEDVVFTSMAAHRNLVVVQFHPEKSGRHGLQLLRNFSNWDGK